MPSVWRHVINIQFRRIACVAALISYAPWIQAQPLIPHHRHSHETHSNSSSVPANWNVTVTPSDCLGTTDLWCQAFRQQTPVAARAYHSANKACESGCHGVGVCNFQLGTCDCMAGWTGPDCKTRQKRPCTNKHRQRGWEPQGAPGSLSEGGFMASRCGGICDEDMAMCFCNGTYGRIPAPEGSPPGTQPVQMGRPMVLNDCNPGKDDQGIPTDWASLEPDLLFSRDYGWCEAQEPRHRCVCVIDGRGGPTCDERLEMTCLNQCSGRGDCWFGFCRCHPGFWGHDCAHVVLQDGALPEEPGLVQQRPWIAQHVQLLAPSTPQLAGRNSPPLVNATRLRPLVYVYDMPSIYNTRLLQYRVVKGACAWRTFREGNVSAPNDWAYGVESLLHEQLLQSEHRTLDPKEADFFYVPVYTSCFIHPVYAWADMPFFYGPGGPRVMHTARMLLEAKRWLQATMPWWDRRGGRDHVWLVTHDEGSCWVPSELRPSVILSHWGRKDLNHESNTAFGADNYSYEYIHKEWSPRGWTQIIKGHACYDPTKDLVIPSYKNPVLIGATPLLGARPLERTVLCSFQGNVGKQRLAHYSRGIRQRLHHLARQHQWQERHRIVIADSADGAGDYSTLLSSSVFCLHVPGDGFSTRAEDSILHGCIPVVIMDDVDPVFATILDWDRFSVRIREGDLEKLPQILEGINLHQRQQMLHRVTLVWHRFLYKNNPLFESALNADSYQHMNGNELRSPTNFSRAVEHLAEDDAFSTVLQWLYSRINATS